LTQQSDRTRHVGQIVWQCRLPKQRLGHARSQFFGDRDNFGHCRAIAFSRTGDPALGDFEDAVILKTVGEIDIGPMSV
jgi:hypothetical protein